MPGDSAVWDTNDLYFITDLDLFLLNLVGEFILVMQSFFEVLHNE